MEKISSAYSCTPQTAMQCNYKWTKNRRFEEGFGVGALSDSEARLLTYFPGNMSNQNMSQQNMGSFQMLRDVVLGNQR